ncbi:YtoQ family protein [Bacillus licheniformis]|nr:YtoQ family protein [Bacillus licheniformis]
MEFIVYLAGEIHSNWREEVKEKQIAQAADHICRTDGNHERSDNIGEEIMGKQADSIAKDDAASDLNNLELPFNEQGGCCHRSFGENTSNGTRQWMHHTRSPKANR